MTEKKIYHLFESARKQGDKKFAVLIDPDKCTQKSLDKIIRNCLLSDVDFIFTGGSLMSTNQLDQVLRQIKSSCNIPVILFPGSTLQISVYADAIFFLSLISGRNPDLLIGRHVEAAPILRTTGLEVISTGYMLIDGGNSTTASYISNTLPVPNDKPDIAACTAMAGEMLGLSTIYLDAGSGAKSPVSNQIIKAVNENTKLPIVVGGGIRTPEMALEKCEAGADIIVVGNAIEEDVQLIPNISSAIRSYNKVTL